MRNKEILFTSVNMFEEKIDKHNNTNKDLHQTCCKFGDTDIQQYVSCGGP